MRLFKRRKNVVPAPTPDENYLAVPTPPRSRIDWKRALPRLLALLLVVAVIGLGVAWAAGAFKDDHKAAPAKPHHAPKLARRPVSPNAPNKPAPAPSAPAAPSKPSQPSSPAAPGTSSTPASTPTAAGQQAPATGQPSSGSQLANTGPGQTLAVFAVTAVAGTAFYQVNLRRRLN